MLHHAILTNTFQIKFLLLIPTVIMMSITRLSCPEKPQSIWSQNHKNLAIFNKWWEMQSVMEGGYSNHPKDNGGQTMRGVTLHTWLNLGFKRSEFRKMKPETARKIALKHFYLPFAKFADNRINTLFCAAFWGGGGYELVKDLQRILNITPDGVIGEVTIMAANEAGPDLFHRLVKCRTKYLKGCWNYEEFRHGWQKSIDFFEEL